MASRTTSESQQSNPISTSEVRAASLSDPNSNPLYVHNADHAGISLVSEKLSGLGNFNTWCRSMLMALEARNKLVFVNGSYPELEESHPDFGSWSRCNNIICTWIVNAVDKSIAKSIMYMDTARQMWLDINDQFKQSNGPRIAEIKQQLYAESQGIQSVSEYYTKLKQLWEELKNHEGARSCCCGRMDCMNIKKLEARNEQDRVLKFLMGLNESYIATRGQILMMEPKPSLSRVFNLISQEERQRSLKSNPTNSAVVFQASQSDQVVAAYTNGYNKQKNRPICSHCGLVGHIVTKCYKLHGYPQGYKATGQSLTHKTQPLSHSQSTKPQQSWNARKENVANLTVREDGVISMHNQQGVYFGDVNQDQIHNLFKVLNTTPQTKNDHSSTTGATFSLADGTSSISKPQPHITPLTQSPSGTTFQPILSSVGIEKSLTYAGNTWVIDTGASCHVCFDIGLFTNLEPISTTSVTLPNGTQISVTLSGSIILPETLTIHSVLFIPHFKFNLLSISALTRNSTISVLFSSHSC